MAGLDLAGHRRPTQLRHPSLPARPSRGSGVTHVHLLRRIPDPFRVNFQNLGFSFKSKTIFEALKSSFEALEMEFDALKKDFVAGSGEKVAGKGDR
jgi:hypothetical protein